MPTPRKPKTEPEVKYPNLQLVACVHDSTPTAPGVERWPAMTAERMKELLGWEAETSGEGSDKVTFKDSLFTDYEGHGVRLLNNAHNRDFDEPLAKRYAHEHLNKHWKMNGETIIFSRYGNVVSGQHRGVSIILAEQLRTSDALEGMPNKAKSQKHHWEDEGWTGPVTMECLLVFGVDEASETLQTLDNGKPRSVYDVLCTLGHFPTLKPKPRKVAVKALDFALKLLWERAGYDDAAWNLYHHDRTHAETLDLFKRHKRIEAAVKHIVNTEGDDGRLISTYIPLGTAAGVMYLMAASGTADAETKYRHGDPPNERMINFDHWDKAEQFWTDLASKGGEALKALRQYITELQKERGEAGITRKERIAIFAKAWVAYLGGSVSKKDLHLEYGTNEAGEPVLTEHPTFGGIDCEEDADVPKLSPEEQAAAKEQQKQERIQRLKDANDKKKAEKATAKEQANDAEKAKPQTRKELEEWNRKQAEMADQQAANMIEQANKTVPTNGTSAPPIPRVKGEVPAPEPVQYDADGKPPTPAKKPPVPRRKAEAVKS
jgi:hypothetical protein